MLPLLLYQSQNGSTEQWVLRVPEAPKILFQAYGRGKIFCFTLCVVLKILRIWRRFQKVMKNAEERILTRPNLRVRPWLMGALSDGEIFQKKLHYLQTFKMISVS